MARRIHPNPILLEGLIHSSMSDGWNVDLTSGALPEVLPGEPMGLLSSWYDEACKARKQPNPEAMTVATVGRDGQPSARVVLCRRIEVERGRLSFFTNYESQKSREMEANPRVACVFHWDAFDRQARVQGRAMRACAAESDAYFAQRALVSRVGAWASAQSRPLKDRETLLAEVMGVMMRFGVTVEQLERHERGPEIPRPPHWGGWIVEATSVELWSGATAGRLHDRAVWTRNGAGSAWSATRLYP